MNINALQELRGQRTNSDSVSVGATNARIEIEKDFVAFKMNQQVAVI